MGTPDFACPTLEKLLQDKNFEIVAVYTKEPQAAGRGQKLTNSPIHILALKHNLKVITPKSLRNSETQQEFINFKADVAVVVAYGLILPEKILSGTKFGCINIHPSKLPQWRGAAPIQRSIMNGDKTTAITIIKMDQGIDSGDIIYQEEISLTGSESYAELAPKLAESGAEILVKTLKTIQNNNFSLTKQNGELATYAKKIEKSECEIDWNESVEKIIQKIRGLSGSIGAFFSYNGEKIKIFSAEIIAENSSEYNAGKILDKDFSIQCGKGVLRPLILQRPGKKAMSLEEFLRGFNL